MSLEEFFFSWACDTFGVTRMSCVATIRMKISDENMVRGLKWKGIVACHFETK